jgi:glycosyltransferase involved in cell wall biosynthesis
MMKFSLVVPSKNRTEEIHRLLVGLKEQTLQDFEIIVSDQNTDDRVVELIEKVAWPGRITHIRSSGGASSARNAGLAVAKGEIVTFPDDDCMYFPDLLERVVQFFDQHPEYGYLNGRSVADDGGDAASSHSKEAGEVEKYKIYQQGIEFTFFVRRAILGDIRFDERLGTGSVSPWQSDEAPDVMLKLMERGVRGYYDPSFKIWHPRMSPTFDEAMVSRCYRYACGSGYFLRKHKYPWWFFAKINIRTFFGVLLGLLTFHPSKARYYWARIQGRWTGWTGYDTEHSKDAAKTL